jgi:hypothetical protein
MCVQSHYSVFDDISTPLMTFRSPSLSYPLFLLLGLNLSVLRPVG